MNRGVVLLAILGPDMCRATLAAPGGHPEHDVLGRVRTQDELIAFLSGLLSDAGNPFLIGAAIAASGARANEDTIMTGRSPWPLDRRILRRALDTPHVQLVQSVVACALAAPGLSAATLHPLHPAPISRDASLATILPEAGLGVAFLFPAAGEERLPVDSDAGCIALTPADHREAAVMKRLDSPALSARDIISRPGFERIHQAVNINAGGSDALLDAAAVMQLARNGDGSAREAIRLYSAWLGAFTSDVALIARARGGVYLNSRFLREMADLLDVQTFAARYLAKNSDAQDMPAFLVPNHTALDGLATLFTPSDARFAHKEVHLLDC